MLLLRRLLPFLVGILNMLCLFLQARSPDSYPWLALVAPASYIVAGLIITYRRVKIGDVAARLAAPALALTASGYGLLLAEGEMSRLLIPIFGGGVSFLALELLFLHVFLPTRYPVNGMSHLNLTLVPATLWFVNAVSSGLVMFIHAPRSVPILASALTGAILFWATAHVEADAEHRRRWSALGGWLGAHLGLLAAFLPLTVTVQGGYAAVFGALALRARRYGIAPHLPKGLVWGELAGAVALLVLMFGTARWM